MSAYPPPGFASLAVAGRLMPHIRGKQLRRSSAICRSGRPGLIPRAEAARSMAPPSGSPVTGPNQVPQVPSTDRQNCPAVDVKIPPLRPARLSAERSEPRHARLLSDLLCLARSVDLAFFGGLTASGWSGSPRTSPGERQRGHPRGVLVELGGHARSGTWNGHQPHGPQG